MKNTSNNILNFIFGVILITSGVDLYAQETTAIGTWRSFPSFNRPVQITTDGKTIYCATQSGFYSYNRQDGSLNGYGKSKGMTELGISAIAYDYSTDHVVLGYENSNIDLFKNETFYNLPDIKIAHVNADKTFNDIICKAGLAYISSGLGIIIIDLEKREIKSTVSFYSNNTLAAVNQVRFIKDTVYAATSIGVFKTSIYNFNIQDYSTWEKISSTIFHQLTTSGNELYAGRTDKVYRYQNEIFEPIFENRKIIDRLDSDPITSGVWVSSKLNSGLGNGFGILIDSSGNQIDTVPGFDVRQVLHLNKQEVWFIENWHGSGIKKKINNAEATTYLPNTPYDHSSFDINAHDGNIWVAHGGYRMPFQPMHKRSMISNYNNGNWHHFPWVSEDIFFEDFIRIVKDQHTGTVYSSSMYGGLLEIQSNGFLQTYSKGYLDTRIGENERYCLFGLALDKEGHLWMTNYGAANELKVKKNDGSWHTMKSAVSSVSPSHNLTGDIIVDDFGQKWYSTLGIGVVVYNDQGTIEDLSDDTYKVLRSGNGGLSNDMVYALAKDHNGDIWLGTADGISIVYCPSLVIEGECEATIPIVQEDEYAGHFFMNQSVNAIAVDGANRKWVGTNNGIWLLSPNGHETLLRFTEENSPLPSNEIYRINIDQINGDVYISTSKGFVVYRGTATKGEEKNEKKLLIYPNPVPAGYSGSIAMRGFAENADVRITDISGQLIFRINAYGGQAVWDGKDYTGKKAQSGVYLIFGVSKDGKSKLTGKIILHE